MATDSKNSNIYLKASTNFKDVAGQINNGLKDIRTSALTTATKFAGIVTAITGIGVSFLSVKKLFDNGLVIQTNFEDAQNDISGLIGSVYSLVDASGKLTEGQEKYTLAIQESRKILGQFEKDAFKFSIKFDDLAGSFKDSIDAANGAGIDANGLQKIVTEVSKLYKARGQDTASAGKDLNDALTGKVKDNSTLGKALNLGNSDAYRKALETNKVMEYILSNVEKTMAGSEVIEDNLGDSLSNIKRNFDVISKSVVSELSVQLKEISQNFSGLFSEEGVPNDGLKIVIANLAYIGGLVGVVLKKGFEALGETITNVSSSTDGIVSALDISTLSLGLMGDVASTLYNSFVRIFNVVASVGDGIHDARTETEKLNEETEKQKSSNSGMKFLIAGWTGVKIIIDSVVSLFVLLIQSIRTFSAFVYGGLVQPFLYLYDAGKRFVNLFKENKDDAQDLNKEYEDSIALLKEQQKIINGQNNGLGNSFGYNDNKTGNQEIDEIFSPISDGVKENYDKFVAADFLNSDSKENRDAARKVLGLIPEGEISAQTDKLKKTLQEIKDNAKKLEEERKNAIKDAGKTATDAAGSTSTVANPNNIFATEKLKRTLDEQLKALQTSSANDRQAFAEKEKYSDLYFSNNLVSYTKYFTDKQRIEKSDYDSSLSNMKSQLSVLQQQKKIEEDLRSNDKNYDVKNLATLNDKIVQQTNDINNLTKDFNFNSKKTYFDATNASKEYQNSLDDMKSKILDLDGLTKDAKKLTLEVEIRGLKDKNQSNPEMLKLIDQFAQSTEFKNKVDDLNDTISDIFNKNSNLEERQNILLNKRKVGELDYYRNVSKIRKDTYNELLQQQADLEEVYNSSGDPKVLNNLDQVKNKILELSLELDPLADKFNEVFNDNFATLFDDLASGTTSILDSFKKMFSGIEKEVQSFASKQLAEQITGSLFKSSGGSFGGVISNMFGGSGGATSGGSSGGFFSSLLNIFGGKATGGNIGRGGMSVVGEYGPELIKSRESSTIYNAQQTRDFFNGGGSAPVYNLNFNLATQNSTSFLNSRNQIMAELAGQMRKMNKYN